MNTPWGEIAVSDAHVHFFSRPLFQALAGQTPLEAVAAKLSWEIPGPDGAELASRWSAELDRYGLKRAALIASYPGDEGSVVEAVRACPGRFFGYFMLNPVADGAVERARSAVEQGRLRGICLFPAMHRFSVQDDRVRPIYELAARNRTVVFVHQGVLTVGVRKRLGLPSPFDMSFSDPIDLHRIALEHPAVNFVIPHFGAGYFRETLMVGDLCPNVHVDTSSTNSWIKYAAGVRDLKEVFARALEVFGPSRILFGSDSSYFPRGWNQDILKTQVEILGQLGVTAETAAAILGGNLERLAGTA